MQAATEDFEIKENSGPSQDPAMEPEVYQHGCDRLSRPVTPPDLTGEEMDEVGW
jgi:hypothetical protein